jgi:hypothetical protein
MPRVTNFVSTIVVLFALGANTAVGAERSNSDALFSWHDGSAKQAVVASVAKVTKQGSPDFVPPAERIATFDNDGTLWCEQPMYVQMAFVLDHVAERAPKHPEWKNAQPFKAVLERDFKALGAQGEKAAVQLVAATHTGMSTEEFNRIAGGWIAAFGNSDGDFQMLQYTATGNGARFRDLDAKIREFLMPANELTWDSPTSFLSDRIGPNTKRESGTASALREEWKPRHPT